MHVLIIPSWYPKAPGEIEGSFFREQAIALKKGGCKVGVIAPHFRSLKEWKKLVIDYRGIEIEDDFGIHTVRKSSTNWFPCLHRLQRRIWLHTGLELFDKYSECFGRPDIIHVHSILNAGIVAQEISKRYKIPFVITEHSSAFARGLIAHHQKEIVRSVSRAAERRFAVSSPFAVLLDSYVDHDRRWEAMPNIVNQVFLDRIVESNVQKSSFIFLNICLLSHNKRVDLLIDAFARSFKGQSGIRLRIGGDGEQRHRLEQLVRQRGVESQVEFVGMLSRQQVVDEMSNADCFILGSQYETFGVVLIEALALGKPVIATRCGGPEGIVREQDGILVPTANVDAMADAMKCLHSARERYDSVEIRKACKERFGERAIVEKLIQVYTDVLVTV